MESSFGEIGADPEPVVAHRVTGVTGQRDVVLVSWGTFEEQEPELARFGKTKLMEVPAYLATIRPSGTPRIHPVTPIISDLGLFVFMEPGSPKGRDLVEREWFALHNGVPDDAGSGGEFTVSGKGFEMADPDLWSNVADAASYTPADRYIMFELRVNEARCNGYGDVTLPSTRKWPSRH